MKCALLFVHLLLLRLLPWGETESRVPAPTEAASPLPETNGSTCAQWLYGTEPPRVEAFECAGQPDGAQVKFCCGTCAQTRNCSVEELAEGAQEPCPPRVPHWVKLLWFCGGVLATVVFYWAFYRPCRRFWGRKTYTFERPEGLEVDTSSSARNGERSSSSDASSGLVPPSSTGAEGLRSPRDGPAATSCYAPKLPRRAMGSENVTVMWFSTGLIPIRVGDSSPELNRGGPRPLTGPGADC